MCNVFDEFGAKSAEGETKPFFLENPEAIPGYYDTPDPYADVPSCKVDLLELSRYARRAGKKLAELAKEEVEQFAISEKSSQDEIC